MKKVVYPILLGLSIAAFVSSCKPREEAPVTPAIVDRSKPDDAGARNELDKVYSDIEKVYNSQQYSDASNLRTTAGGAILPCGKVTFNAKSFTIDYSKSGMNCGTRVLSGSVEVSLFSGNQFSDPGAVLKIEYTKYKILYYVNNQSITYNGISYVTNGPNGGTMLSLYTTTPATVEHRVRGLLTLTFDTTGTGTHNVTREWNIRRKNTYTSNGTAAGIAVTVEGDTTIALDTYIPGEFVSTSEYGISRDGDKFVCQLATPFNWSNCGTTYEGPYILKQGKVQYTVDLTNNPISAGGITTGAWSATAGYKYIAPNNTPFDGSCSSDGYKLDFSLKNSSGVDVYSTTSFQAY
ncbi:hypothetical protein [uncultured Cytophaga sp.]|uniref:hypothetical protein n=1 Tax=uncultured Cytophaga sp. TaxID=160238 RepID=UPI00261025D2|nr:hypothetical protein [uncultured Cytophaga sp.]